MELTLLGTGGMLPLPQRHLTSLYAEHEGRAVLIDCGEGTQVAAARFGCKLSRIRAILFTHRHTDHVAGLPGLLLSLGNTGRTEPLPVYCGEDCVQTIRHLTAVTGGLPYPVTVHPLPDHRETHLPLPEIDPGFSADTLPLDHSVPCLGYRLTLTKRPVFDPERARALGVPLPDWKRLHSGESVRLPDGRCITQDMVTAAARAPLCIVYTTDTRPVPEIALFARGADLFVCEGMYGTADKHESMEAKGHMLMQDACTLAARAGAARLWLTHYSPAEKTPEQYTDALQTLFSGTVISRDGQSLHL
ncbi:MAG: ribonuclease Z [Oscillospiraceae bacterium]|nr:ribonuclease Z [Oscillospiraceae bacterium]